MLSCSHGDGAPGCGSRLWYFTRSPSAPNFLPACLHTAPTRTAAGPARDFVRGLLATLAILLLQPDGSSGRDAVPGCRAAARQRPRPTVRPPSARHSKSRRSGRRGRRDAATDAAHRCGGGRSVALCPAVFDDFRPHVESGIRRSRDGAAAGAGRLAAVAIGAARHDHLPVYRRHRRASRGRWASARPNARTLNEQHNCAACPSPGRRSSWIRRWPAPMRPNHDPTRAVLVGVASGAGYEWTFGHAGQVSRTEGPLAEGVNFAADTLASRYAPASTRGHHIRRRCVLVT